MIQEAESDFFSKTTKKNTEKFAFPTLSFAFIIVPNFLSLPNVHISTPFYASTATFIVVQKLIIIFYILLPEH